MNIKIDSSSTYNLDYHFRDSRMAMRPLFDEFIKKLRKKIYFEYKIGKAYIGLINKLVFVCIRIQTKKIIIEFTSRKLLTSKRFTKILHFQKDRWAYFLNIVEVKDIDEELLDWIIEGELI